MDARVDDGQSSAADGGGAPAGRRIAWTISALVMLAALLAPALWNGFPILFHDTGGYLVRPFEGTLVLGRSVVYGLLLAAGRPLGFWPAIVLQAALIAWLLVLTLRAHGLGGRPWLAAALVAGLAIVTSLPWYAAQLMPDVLLPAGVIALHLLAHRGETLSRAERLGLAALIAFAVASHMATFGLLAALVVALVVVRPFAGRLGLVPARLGLAAAALAAGLALVPIANLAVTGRPAPAAGSENYVFGRLVQDGIVARYLADVCPDPQLGLCAYRDRMPTTADDWLWDEPSPLHALGGPDAFTPEARRIIVDSVARYPLLHLSTMLQASWDQFFSLATGDGLGDYFWHTRWALETYAPGTAGARAATPQQRGEIDFRPINRLHVPLAFAAIVVLALIAALGRGGRVTRPAATLAVLVLGALALNAVICGVLSNPHARYQSRLAPLAPLAVVVALMGRRRTPPPGPDATVVDRGV